ncbi:MAG: cobaltochelatase subunit CobN [Methanosarcinaceae archaeon]|nr:cobaltochelatase subunit CobN [Methanosarcinaceae archaeon]
MTGEVTWYSGSSDLVVENGATSGENLTISSSSTVTHESVLGYLNRTTVSGFALPKRGSPKSNVTVVLTGSEGKFITNTTSDTKGNYIFENVSNGIYKVLATVKAISGMTGEVTWYSGSSDLVVENGAASGENLTISSSSTVTHESVLGYLNRTTVSGFALPKRGSPKPNVTVVLTGSEGKFITNTTSDTKGNYIFENVSNGEYKVFATVKAISGMTGEVTWYSGSSDLVVENGAVSGENLTISSSSTVTHESVLGYLNRTTVSGFALPKRGSPKPNVTVVLLKEKDIKISNSPHLNISIITGYANYDLKLKTLGERINGTPALNMTFSYYLPATSGEDVDLSNMDIIYVNMFTDSAGKLEETINEAIANGAVVIGYNTFLPDSINETSLPAPHKNVEDFKKFLQEYWIYGATDESNFDNLMFYLAQKYYDREDLEVLAPRGASSAIYHPGLVERTDDKACFTSNATEYFEWYSGRNESKHSFDPDAPTVGILFYLSYYPHSMQPLDALIEEFESRNVNVITCYGSSSDYVDKYLKYNDSTKVDLIISSTYRSQYFNVSDLGGVPVINSVLNGYMNLTEWQEVNDPLTSTYMIRMYRPETWGWIDPMMIASQEIDNETGTELYVSVDEQVDWLADRAVAQTELSRKNESDKKVAIIYYSHGCGKDSIGASYLEVIPSIRNLLSGMAKADYNVEEASIPNKSELTDLMVKQGTNIGTWAPGELEKLVKSGKAELLPESTYLEWFEALPEVRREEVIEMWGPAPGKIMVYENASGERFLVLPKIEISENVILAPQPTRGWLQDSEVLYHSKDLPPHHQYIAFYLWLQKEYGADALVNMGRHGTVEWLPGKEFGLFRDEWPALMNGDIPVIYPYVMDGMGEGMQAKRRGNAVIIDHLIPPVVLSGSYGNYSELSDKIAQYLILPIESDMKERRMQEIVELTLELNLDESVNVSLAESNKTEAQFLDELEDTLRKLRTTSMPYGLHILGTTPEGEELTQMVYSMLGNGFVREVAILNNSNASDTDSEVAPLELLDLVLLQNESVEDAQQQVLGNSSGKVSDYLTKAQEYAEKLGESKNEIQQILKALDGKYIEANLGGDPVLRPDALPSGRNFYAFDEQLIPTKQAWDLGKEMANQTIEAYRDGHDGQYPKKVGLILWAGESTRHEGVMEAEILYLLGVRPVWDEAGGEVEDVELIDSSELNRPRIDVLVQISGLYRDTFPHKVELIDKAVYLAYNAPDRQYDKDGERPTPEYIFYNPAENTNYVRENTNNIFLNLNTTLQNETASMTIALLRVFGPANGAYGTGMANAVSASNTWENNSELAELYINRMSNAYGEYVWGESAAEIVERFQVDGSSLNNTDVFESNLEDIKVTVHSRSSSTYGALDTNDFYQYLGGLNLAVKHVSGIDPESYITNLQNPGAEEVETLSAYLTREISTRYLNPKWIAEMQKHGLEGAGTMSDIIDNLWGWEALNPDLISDDVWNQMYRTYIGDPELSDWLKSTNPNAYESITARMIETIQKNQWGASDTVLKNLMKEYLETVLKENAPCCCHHTCGNPELNAKIYEGLQSIPGVSQEDLEKFADILLKATKEDPRPPSKPDKISASHGGGTGAESVTVRKAGNSTVDSDSGFGTIKGQTPTPTKKSDAGDYVEGYEMDKEANLDSEKDSGDMTFSSSDLLASVFVLAALGAIFLGLRRRKF